MLSSFRLQKRTQELCKSYGQDWALVFVVLVAFSLIDQLEPFHRQFSVRDVTIQHPFAKQETVPDWLLVVLAFVLPMGLMSLIAIFQRKSYTDLHNAFLGLFLAQSLVLIVTDSVKIAVGRPRPDFLDRCLSVYDNIAAGTPLPVLSDPANILSDSSICTRQELLRDGFKAFPSGHSSFSFGGLGYLSMYLAGKLHLFDERGHIYKSLIVLAPLILAALIATSRVADYRHHWQDVTAGSFIGITFAIFGYRQYYPSLASTNSDAPFSPRVKEDFLPTNLFERYRDDADDDLIDTGEAIGRGHATATSNGGAENGQSTATRRGGAGAGNNRGMSGVLGQFFRQENGEPEGPGGVIKTHTKPGGGGTYSKLNHTPVGQNGDASTRGQQQPQQPAEGFLVNI